MFEVGDLGLWRLREDGGFGICDWGRVWFFVSLSLEERRNRSEESSVWKKVKWLYDVI